MTESNPASEPRLGVRSAVRLRRALLGTLAAAVVIAVLQWLAPATDYQFAFLASAAVGFIGVLYALYQLHRAAAAIGHRWSVPAALILVVLTTASLLRFQSFSGELVPQFEWRFARDQPPPLVTELSLPHATPEMTPDADVTGRHRGDGERDVNERDSGAENAEPKRNHSPGFLGPNRNGVINDRQFSVPEASGDVEVLWNIGIGQGWGAFAVSGELAVTLEQRDDQECVTAYRLADGTMSWIHRWEARHEHPLGGVGPRSTPTIDQGRVYAQGATGQLWCLSLASGEVLWEQDLLSLAGWSQKKSEDAVLWGRAGSPLLVDGLCVVPFGAPTESGLADNQADDQGQATTGGRSLIAFDAATGEIRWTAGEDQISYASPQLLTLAGKRQIVIVNEQSVTGHAPDSGNTLWSFPWPGQSNAAASCASAIPAGPDRFLVGKGYGGGSALVQVSRPGDEKETMTAEAVWTSSRLLKTKFNHACVDREVAYGIGNGALEAVDLENQQSLWRQPRRQRCGQGQLLLAGDVLIVQTEPGEVLFVDADPEEYRQRFRLQGLSSKTWNIPTLAGRWLLVRNDQQAIAYLLPKPD